MVECPGCGARFPSSGLPMAARARAAGESLAAYHELTARTLTLGDPEFVHQHAVDAWTAQHAGPESRPIGTFFALAGLYLALERGFTGRQVQEAHMRMSKGDRTWPTFVPPSRKGNATVIEAAAHDDLAEGLRRWIEAVWSAWTPEQPRVRAFTAERLE